MFYAFPTAILSNICKIMTVCHWMRHWFPHDTLWGVGGVCVARGARMRNSEPATKHSTKILLDLTEGYKRSERFIEANERNNECVYENNEAKKTNAGVFLLIPCEL